MQPLADFELCRPATLAEATALLAHDEHTLALAGGTDLLPNLRRGLHAPRRLVELGALNGWPGWASLERGASHWRLGAGVTLATLATHEALAAHWPALVQAAQAVAGPGHRSAATLGGNLCQDTRCVFYNQSAWWRAANGGCLKRGGTVCHVAPQGQHCHAAFCSDLAPALIACGAQAEVGGPQGSRCAPLEQLYHDDGAAHLGLGRGELLTAVHLPLPKPGSRSGFTKQRVRGAMDFPLASVAAHLRRVDDTLAELVVAVSGTQSRPLKLEGTEALLGRALDEALLAELGRAVQRQVRPMRSTLIAAHHRRRVAAVAAQGLVQALWAA